MRRRSFSSLQFGSTDQSHADQSMSVASSISVFSEVNSAASVLAIG
jgi:hypothetical protein